MSTPDFATATTKLAELVRAVPDDALENPTPCEGRTVGQLLHHLDGLTQAFTAAAAKDFGPLTDTSPEVDGGWGQAPEGWRDSIPTQAISLAAAWEDPSAWQGMTRAGGVDLPGEVAGLVALDEVVLHSWDLAKATGQSYSADADTTAVLTEFVGGFDPEGTPGMFGPAATVDEQASDFDKLLAASGRQPDWPAL